MITLKIPTLKKDQIIDITQKIEKNHILSSIISVSLSIPFKSGKLLLGSWQRVVLIELNGPTERILHINLN